MGKRIKEVDTYIAKAPAFAKPILNEIRDRMHEAWPEIEECLKWSVPHFDHKGPILGMAAFKAHANFHFWRAPLLKDPKGYLKVVGASSMGGRKITSVKDLPPKAAMRVFIRESARLNEAGIKPPSKPRKPVKAAAVPADLMSAMKKNTRALEAFQGFSPSHKNEYVEWIAEAKQEVTRERRVKQAVEWITEAKQEATRERRVAQAIEWMAEGKSRNWKYQQ